MSSPSDPSGATRALADLAFGSQTRIADTSRPLAWLSPEELAIDLADPVQRRFGDYELVERIGQGGMGVVYRARQHGLERDVALKLLAAGPWASDEFVARFRREAKSAARMQHPNIVEIYEFGERDGLNYFSMRLIEGQTLAQRIAARGPLPPAEAARLLRTLAEAMDYAHRLGVLHLDLKPANVLMTQAGEPLIADFGLARRIDAGHEGGTEISGTPSYMAPEQAQLESHPLTASTDIYGLGAILYETLTGRPPFTATDAQHILARVIGEAPTPPRQANRRIPADLEAICLHCLEKEPVRRYASAKDLAEDLARFLEARPVSVRPLSSVQRMVRWARREPRVAMAAAAAFLALAVGMSSTTLQWREAAAQRDAARRERDRAAIASGIGAWLFTRSADAGDDLGRARGLLDWLDARLPGDEARQADALTAFATSVRESEDDESGALFNLLSAIIATHGSDYRRALVASLEASGGERRHLHAALLAFYDSDPDANQRFRRHLQSALAARPDDPLAWHVAAHYCPLLDGKVPCVEAAAGEQLVRLDPDNMYPWLTMALESNDPAQQREALRQAARRTRFDDYSTQTYQAYFDAVRDAAVPSPPLLAGPIRLFGEDQSPEAAFASLDAANSPMPAWYHLTRICLPEQLELLDAGLRSDCVAVGTQMLRSNGSLLSRMIGVALVLPLSRGTPLADEARSARREYEYVKDATRRLPDAPDKPYSAERFTRDIATVGELAAWQRRLEYFGVPSNPPADWQPEDGYRLMSARERIDNTIATHEQAAALLAQGRNAEAARLLAPMEAAARRFFQDAHAWRLARYLLDLGQARRGLGQFAEAEKALLEAWELLQPSGPGSSDAKSGLRSLVRLYEDWHLAAPGQGHDATAGQWRQRREDFTAQELAIRQP